MQYINICIVVLHLQLTACMVRVMFEENSSSDLHKNSCVRFEVFRAVLRHVTLVITDVSEEPSASFIRVTRMGELGRTLAVTSNRYFFAACVGC
jgi:hypothetical protein